MTKLALITASLLTVLTSASHAVIIEGFENGLSAWAVVNDASIQARSIGLEPTEGNAMLFLTTATASGGNYNPFRTYSGYASGRALLGLPLGDEAFYAAMGTPYDAAHDFGGAAKFRFEATQAGILSFDWNKIGSDGDVAFLTVWSETGTFRSNIWIYGG